MDIIGIAVPRFSALFPRFLTSEWVGRGMRKTKASSRGFGLSGMFSRLLQRSRLGSDQLTRPLGKRDWRERLCLSSKAGCLGMRPGWPRSPSLSVAKLSRHKQVKKWPRGSGASPHGRTRNHPHGAIVARVFRFPIWVGVPKVK